MKKRGVFMKQQKKQKKENPFESQILDADELVLEAALVAGDYQEAVDEENNKEILIEAADRYQELHKSKSVTIRVNQLDLIKFKAKAKDKNVPYQTLLGILIRHYADGELKLSL
jgi:predicted DNA binding CopG/RHH family protein